MHFIQNSWFVVYSIWLLALILGVVGIILYIHNRQVFLRKIAVYFSITFVSAMVFSFSAEKSVFLDSRQISLTEMKNDNKTVESPSLLNGAFRFIGSILRDKISN